MRWASIEKEISDRRQDLDALGPCLGDVLDHVVGVRLLGGQQRGHELDRIVTLEIGGLISDECVGGRV
jgi:hypothetical protein